MINDCVVFNWNESRELAKKMKTEIQYNFGDQYFEITGRSQQACDDTYV